MAVGAPPNMNNLNQTLSMLAVSLRDISEQIANFQMIVTGLGTAGLVALGFSAQDATALVNQASYLNTIAGVYYGTATQGTNFNFHNALSGSWGGQP